MAGFDRAWDHAARAVVGYGCHPFRSLTWLLGLSLVATLLAALAWGEGSMVPNNALVAGSVGWQAVLARACLPDRVPGCLETPAAEWSSAVDPGVDRDGFLPLAHGVDVVIAVLDLCQTRSWAPSRDRGPRGHRLWWARRVLMTLGWVVTALGAAAATGIIQR